MKIGYIYAGSMSKRYGVEGGAVHIQEVCNALKRLGHDVFIVGGQLPEMPRSLRQYEVRLESPLQHPGDYVRNFLSSSKNNRSPSNTDSSMKLREGTYEELRSTRSLYAVFSDVWEKIWNMWTSLSFFNQALPIVSIENPDFLYERGDSNRVAGFKLASHCGIPLFIELNGSNAFRREWQRRRSILYPWIVRRSERHICKSADAVIVITAFLQQYLAGLGVPEEKVFVLPNGVDPGKFCSNGLHASSIRQKFGLEGKRVVGFVGGLRWYHGMDILIESARVVTMRANNVHFLIVGDGPPMDALQHQSRKQGVDDVVTFAGSISHEEVPSFINAMDVTVAPFPKIPEFHFSPIKVFEYMAMAKPVIASRYPDTESVIVNGYNGLLVEPGNCYVLANAILRLLADTELRTRLGSQARRTVEQNYTWEGNARKIVEIYYKLLRSGRS